MVAASALLFAASLALPALAETHSDGVRIDELGYVLLETGWAGLLIGQIAWFANPLWVLGAILLWRGRWKGAAKAAVGALLVGSVSFFLMRTGVPSESGPSITARLLVGFYVWWASLWVLAIGAVVYWLQTRPKGTAPPDDEWPGERRSGSRNRSS